MELVRLKQKQVSCHAIGFEEYQFKISKKYSHQTRLFFCGFFLPLETVDALDDSAPPVVVRWRDSGV